MIHRRSFITGLISLVAAPAIVRAGSLMPVRGEMIEFEFCDQKVYLLPIRPPTLGKWLDQMAKAQRRMANIMGLPYPPLFYGNTLLTDLSHSSSPDEAIAAPRQRQVVLG